MDLNAINKLSFLLAPPSSCLSSMAREEDWEIGVLPTLSGSSKSYPNERADANLGHTRTLAASPTFLTQIGWQTR